ncbi:glycoside hydrolase family 2 TIM barrel-domain containing protein [Granulicella arctica]|uniref:Beta-galactosidase/beta-glucuronidase n=1 Tax=Granulicella arctica TaxID=940613 RepID=A0A7Y9PGS8_9BACT|nr:glycoside hydrolase family 2 TIM barrel-domain containing protein [Granulicella arctica]NYF79591.1 beta-galactosidase/beta-glucuronidase [Granulicella arctica]
MLFTWLVGTVDSCFQPATVTDDIGFRDIRVDGTRILLNGRAIFLQGAYMRAEAPIRGGRINTIFDYLKDMNANFVRLAHYPHDERMEHIANRDGFMIWSQLAAHLF